MDELEKDFPVNKIVCFGEALWDVYADKMKPGGAPMNVAYNLNKLGIDCKPISRVGNDKLGEDLLTQFADWQIATNSIGIDNVYPTSTVGLIADENKEVSYSIYDNVAWDHIPLLQEYIDLVKDASVLVFGTLSMRNQITYKTLLKLLDVSKIKVLDINIRLPYFSIEKLLTILPKVDILKLNKAELSAIIDALEITIEGDENIKIKYLQQRFGIEEIIMTKGSTGAVYYRKDFSKHYDSYKIIVNDTVGSGDAFLAGFLSARFNKNTCDNNDAIMNKATVVGAFITTKEGGCPIYSLIELEEFQYKHSFI